MEIAYPCVKGLVHVTGPVGVGKTTFAITAAPPERVLVFDFERSAAPYAEEYGIAYHDVVTSLLIAGKESSLDLYEYYVRAQQEVPRQYDVVVLDNIAPLQEAYEAYVRANYARFGLTPGQMERSPALAWGPIRQLFRADLHRWHTLGAKLVITTSHLRDDWSAGRPLPGLQRPQAFPMVREVAVLALWLRHNVGSRVPAALVLKDRLGKVIWANSMSDVPPHLRDQYTEDDLPGPVVMPCLPRRLPVCTWPVIARYLQHPADWAHPKPEETPSEEELHVLRGTLPQEARDALRLAVLDASRQEQERAVPTTHAELLSRALKELGLTAGQILETLGVSNIQEVSPQDAWLKLLAER